MKFIDPRHDCPRDPWHTIGGEDGPMVTITPASHLLLTLPQWHSVRATWPADKPVGVALPNDAAVEDLAPDLARIALITLHFPKWTDGRAYSQARLLKQRYRYADEVRATGDVLVDMVPLLDRTGFDVAVLRHDQSPEAAANTLAFFPTGHYQADVAEHRPLFGRPGAPA